MWHNYFMLYITHLQWFSSETLSLDKLKQEVDLIQRWDLCECASQRMNLHQ